MARSRGFFLPYLIGPAFLLGIFLSLLVGPLVFHRSLTPQGGSCLAGDAAPLVGPGRGDTPLYAYKIINVYPHDPDAFTQGLIFRKGFLYESTGLNGKSTLRKVELETGRVLKSHALPARYFGEGLTEWRGTLIQLTWQSRVGFIYDRRSFVKLGEFSYATEGWGITHDGTHLIMSDGSATLQFLNPNSFVKEKTVTVLHGKAPVAYLNELEYIKGEVFANVWRTDLIARISPETGQVVGWVDLSGLSDALDSNRPVDVLNGIAYDRKHDRIYVTGKLWPKLFEIELVRKK